MTTKAVLTARADSQVSNASSMNPSKSAVSISLDDVSEIWLSATRQFLPIHYTEGAASDLSGLAAFVASRISSSETGPGALPSRPLVLERFALFGCPVFEFGPLLAANFLTLLRCIGVAHGVAHLALFL